MATNSRSPMSTPENGVLILPSHDGKKTVEYPYITPTAEQIALFTADAAPHNSFPTKVSAVFNLLEDMLENESDYGTVRLRLRDRDDSLGIQDLLDAIKDVVEEQSNFPFESLPDSTPSPSPTGRRSTGRVQPGE